VSEEEKLQIENECLLKYSKAQMIQKYIDELEESGVLSDLWCKSQEKIKKAIEYIDWQRRNPQYDNVWRNRECEDLIEILKGEE
jgi:hypothetical protein